MNWYRWRTEALAFIVAPRTTAHSSRLLKLGRGSRSGARVPLSAVLTPASMFALGVLGNAVAIAALAQTPRGRKDGAFYALVCGLAVTDLLGTCLSSPVVIAGYVRGGWPGGDALCGFFAFTLLFFGAAGISILCAMSVERYLAINHPYVYNRYVDARRARAALAALYVINGCLCALPCAGVGRSVAQFPGTWCFLDWRSEEPTHAAYNFAYGGYSAALIAITVFCNIAVCRALLRMKRRTFWRSDGRLLESSRRGRWHRRGLRALGPSAAEVQMLWLLLVMTVVFLVCSIPLVVRIFVNQLHRPPVERHIPHNRDILAIRLASFNPILDPWVYILCRRGLLGRLVRLCRRLTRKRTPVTQRRARGTSVSRRMSVYLWPKLTQDVAVWVQGCRAIASLLLGEEEELARTALDRALHTSSAAGMGLLDRVTLEVRLGHQDNQDLAWRVGPTPRADVVPVLNALQLNAVTRGDAFPIPCIDDTFDGLAGDQRRIG
ncbi:prostaglandin E2 receptor EP4 subtype-like [Lampetra fluviatilis]